MINYWKQFAHTGKVEDYLSYRQQNAAEHTKMNGGAEAGKEERETGVVPYAGVHMGDGDDSETDTHRGI